MQSTAHPRPIPDFDTAAQFARNLHAAAKVRLPAKDRDDKRGPPPIELTVRDGKIATPWPWHRNAVARQNAFEDLRASLQVKLKAMQVQDVGAMASRLMDGVVSNDAAEIPVQAARLAALQTVLRMAEKLKLEEGIKIEKALALVMASAQRTAADASPMAGRFDALQTAARIAGKAGLNPVDAIRQAEKAASGYSPVPRADTKHAHPQLPASPAKLQESSVHEAAGQRQAEGDATFLVILVNESTQNIDPPGPVIHRTAPATPSPWLKAACLAAKYPDLLPKLPTSMRANLLLASAQGLLDEEEGAREAYRCLLQSFDRADLLPPDSKQAERWKTFASARPPASGWADMDRLDRTLHLLTITANHGKMFGIRTRPVLIMDEMVDQACVFQDGYILVSGHASRGWNHGETVDRNLVGMLASLLQSNLASAFDHDEIGALDSHEQCLARIFHAATFAGLAGDEELTRAATDVHGGAVIALVSKKQAQPG